MSMYVYVCGWCFDTAITADDKLQRCKRCLNPRCSNMIDLGETSMPDVVDEFNADDYGVSFVTHYENWQELWNEQMNGYNEFMEDIVESEGEL